MNILRFIFLILILSSVAGAQTVPQPATASIAGQIKNGDQPARGIAVTLSVSGRGGPAAVTDPSTRATTDDNGQYKFANIAAGRYRVTVLAPGYVIFGTSDLTRNGQQIPLKDGEAVERIDFTLTKGGVVTGKVTSNGNRQVIGEAVNFMSVDDSGQSQQFNPPEGVNIRTDDRGVYRAFGLPAGKYRVSVGQDIGRGGGGFGGGFGLANRTYQRTFYPAAAEETDATIINVEAGHETKDIDIQLATLTTYAAIGRVVDGESGKTVPGVLIGHSISNGNRRGPGGGGFGGNTDGVSGNEGEFKIEGLRPGSYSAYVAKDQTTAEFYSEPTSFDVVSQDATGIEIKLQRGASIAGLAVLEGNTDPLAVSTIQISAFGRGGGGNNAVNVAPNGTFRVAGLAPGRVNLSVSDSNNPGPFSGLTVMRIERDGAPLTAGLEVTAGEQIMGVRIVMAYGNSIVRGVVKTDDGSALTPDMRLIVMARRTDGASSGGGIMGGAMPTQVDPGGKFQIEKLVPGTYDITVQAMGGGGFGGGGRPQGGQGGQAGQVGQGGGQVGIGGGRGAMSAAAKQSVTVGSGTTQEVVLTLNVAALTAPNTQGSGQGTGRPNQGAGGQNPNPGNQPGGRGRRP